MSKPTVLLVDDEPIVLRLVASALLTRGFEVYAISSPVHALQLAKKMPYFDMLVSDVNMPGICGPDLARQILQICPTIGIVMMSASSDFKGSPSGAECITKPFVLTDLYSVVEKTLARSSA